MALTVRQETYCEYTMEGLFSAGQNSAEVKLDLAFIGQA